MNDYFGQPIAKCKTQEMDLAVARYGEQVFVLNAVYKVYKYQTGM